MEATTIDTAPIDVAASANTGATAESTTNIFERAARRKLRWSTAIGVLGVEQLWEMELTTRMGHGTSLDSIARNIRRALREAEDESFVTTSTKPSVDMQDLQLRFDIVLHIIKVRMAEAEAAKQVRERREKKQRIMTLIAEKQDAALSAKSEEDLQKMLAEL